VGVDPYHLHHLRCLFLCFEDVSGLKINLAKSELVHVGLINNIECLARILGCREKHYEVPSSSFGCFF
jgi:hypothetical protein